LTKSRQGTGKRCRICHGGIGRFTGGGRRQQQGQRRRFLVAEQESAALGFGEAAGQGEADAVTRAEGALAER
jgi:hypothetical protein